MPRLPAPAAALKTTTTMDVDTSIYGQRQPSLQHPAPSNSQNPLPQQSNSTTIPQDIRKINQTDDEQSDVEEKY